jgi:hypothetical protein
MRQKRHTGPVRIALQSWEARAATWLPGIDPASEILFTKIADLTGKALFSHQSGFKDAPLAAQCMVGLG